MEYKYTLSSDNNRTIPLIPELKIDFDKRKLKLLIALCFGVLALGLWLIFAEHDWQLTLGRLIPINNTFLGTMLVVLAIYGLYSFYRKITIKEYALIINETGIFDNYTRLSLGQIYWEDIEDVEIVRIQQNVMIYVYIANRDKYVEQIESAYKRKLLKAFKFLNSRRLVFPMSGLQISKEELYAAITSGKDAYLSSKQRIF